MLAAPLRSSDSSHLEYRALRTNRDFDRYWTFHLAQERLRVDPERYAGMSSPAN